MNESRDTVGPPYS